MRLKTVIIILTAVLTVVLGAVAFLIGMLLGNNQQNQNTQTAEQGSAPVSDTEHHAETESIPTEATADTVTIETASTEVEMTTVTTVTESNKPTVTNAYLYYNNTAYGCKLYLHVEGAYAFYQYQVYFRFPNESDYRISYQGESAAQEFLLSEGLSEYGIELYKALITAWNQDRNQSTEQWAYVDGSKSFDGSIPATFSSEPKQRTYLKNGFVMTKNADLNLRSQPNTNSAVLKKIPKTTFLCLYESGTDGWYWTEYDGAGGYVSAEYVYNPAESYTDGQYYQEQACCKTGRINTHGATVPGYTWSRIIPNGDTDSVERKSLGEGWHVVSNQYMVNPEATYYELYDSQDGDYYGWVDETFIDWDS